MKTDKLTRLISALGKPAYQKQAEQRVTQEAAAARLQDTDAVKISSTLTAQENQQVESSPRQRKVNALKAQIEAGAYNRTSEEIAMSLIRELGL